MYVAAKRAVDLILCFAMLPLVLPTCAIVALMIKLYDGGPIFYRGLRTGQHGIRFRILKFRTMVVDAEKRGGGTTALKDPRILPFGHLLRRYKIDELPQVFNVLGGTMSLVGPRPELPAYTDRYNAEERAILLVKPGITDYSSIRFSSLDEVVGSQNADAVFEASVLPEKNRLRLRYVAERSIATDLRILALTVWKVLSKIVR